MKKEYKENFTAAELATEIWKDIPIEGLIGRYQISSLGRVKSLARLQKRGNSYLPVAEKIRKIQLRKDGYLQIDLTIDGKQRSFMIHRLVALSFIDLIEGKDEVNHLDEDKQNNRVENLEWVNREENMSHNNLRKKNHIKALETKRKNKVVSLMYQPIIAIENDGSIIEFKKQSDACRFYDLSSGAVSANVRGRTKTTKIGVVFKLKEQIV